jgi:transcriptional regulator with XRE-family HTH domain
MIHETLAQFVRRVMKQKALNARDIERNSNKKIDNSYISKIINGSVTNLTANAIVALAQGLQVNPHELFTAISGREVEPDREQRVDSYLLVEMMQQVVMNPEMMELLQEWGRLPEGNRAWILESMRFLNEENQRVSEVRRQEEAKLKSSTG